MHKQLLLLFTALVLACGADALAPTITSFSPSSGPVGTLVTITGTNLSSPTAFLIGGVAAIVVSDNGTALVGMVMPGATTGVVSVTTAGGTVAGGSSYLVTTTPHPAAQQGPKLTGIDESGAGAEGSSVSISADGNTAIVGGYVDSGNIGAVWVYTRSAGSWTQQGPKLTGTGYSGQPDQGWSVAISADGNTAIIGGPSDNSNTGAVWIYTRSGGIWSQQGPKLTGSGAAGAAFQGASVSISADGNTVLFSGPQDSSYIGAAWVFTRSAGTWTQQGHKLIGTGYVAIVGESAVALSGDGNTAIIGGPGDNSNIGAIWVFVRSGGVWTQQGGKLIGTGAANGAFFGAAQGTSVSVSADGNTLIEGGPDDKTDTGAVWIFTRSAGIWTQQGGKLVGTGILGSTGYQGYSVSISADGNTAVTSGYADSNYTGAAWVYTRSGSIWTQQGSKLVGTGAIGHARQGISIAVSANGTTAIVGGTNDNNFTGASWVFANSCSPGASIVSHSICSGSSYIFGTRTLTTSGTYHDTLTGSGGCDSIVTLTLAVNNLPAQPTITHTGNTLSTTAAGVSYQWQLNGTNLPGDTNSTLLVTQNGNYTLIVTDQNGCSSTSTSVNITSVGIDEMSADDTNIRIYPNPATESFTLAVAADMIGASYSFSDIMGRMIESRLIEKENTVVSVAGLSSGIYILQINDLSYKVVKE